MAAATSKVKPLKGFVMIEPYDRMEEFRGRGIEMPEIKEQGIPNRGVVKYVADDVKSVKPGDTVLFKAGQPMIIKSLGVFAIKIDDIEAVIS